MQRRLAGTKPELGRADADDADDGAVDTRDDPALPEFLANEDGGGDGEHAGEIVQSNHVEHVQHMGLMSRGSQPRGMSQSGDSVRSLLLTAMNTAARDKQIAFLGLGPSLA